MLKIIGVILLIYGLLGVLAALWAYVALRGPAQSLKDLLQQLAQQITQSSTAARRVSDWMFKQNPILQSLANFIGQIDKLLHEAGKRFNDAAQALKNLEAGMDAIKVPVVSFQTQTLDLQFGATVVESFSLQEYKLDIVPGPGGEFTLYGPPLTVNNTTVGLNLGQVPVVSGMTVTDGYPLQPIGDAFKFVGGKIDEAKAQIEDAADRFGEVKTRTLELKENLEKSVEDLKNFVEQLKAAGAKLEAMSGVRVLTLLPALAVGFFVFIHLAFALTGYALLTL
jgi:uncharacterized phage infection (PIP) family protein YhgE